MTLEIITLRGISRNRKRLERLLQELQASRPDAEIWTRQPEGSDVSILLHQTVVSSRTGTSVVGLRLASELTDCGMVHHSTWRAYKEAGME